MSKYAKLDDVILTLHDEGLNNKQIGLKLNIDSRRVSDRLHKHGLNNLGATSNKELNVTTENLNQLLLGTIIGDGCIFKGKGNKNYRMNLAHSLKQKEYFLMKYNILYPIVNSNFKERSWIDNRTMKEYSEIKLQTLTNPLYTKLYKIWYKDGKKIIPRKAIMELNEQALAIKYFDDGSKTNHSYSFSMYDYDNNSIANFINWIDVKFGIEATHQKSDNTVYILKKHREHFKELIIQYATKDVLYKLGELRETH